MASASRPEWKILPISNHAQSSNSILFFTLQRHEDGLKLEVTDLVYLWLAAKTSKEDLKEEAARSHCSIDPSEDEEQYEVLISRLEDAVSGLGGASIRIGPSDDGEDDARRGFEIEASIPLPRPLGILQWRFRLVRQGAEALMKELVLPALASVESSRKREEDLRRKLKEKDHVITKLVDKIEASGIDLSAVFPGFVGARKGLSVRQAAKVVPGIEAFKEDEWEWKGRKESSAGMKEVLDALRDVEAGEMVWRGPMTTLGASNSNRRAEVKQSPHKKTRENEVTAVLVQVKGISLTA